MLKTLEAPEIVFGLCSAIGTDNSKIVRLIEDTLKSYSYHAEYFKVTNLMRSVILNHHELVEKPIEKRYDTYIKYANKLRELFEDDGVLGTLCCAALKSFRRQREDLEGSYLPSHAYIFDQFKRKEEIATLRQVYGRLFVMISIYSDKQSRINNLSERIAQDHAVARPDLKHLHMARRLVERDEEEEEIESGQRLRDAFPMADVFVNIDDMISARHVLERFLSAFFGSNSTSPTRDEYGMYLAKSAALRSLDLSRQVGAAIFAKEGEIISLGSNEVPKAGGGTYWVDDGDDAREYKVGRDENERIKRAILADLVRRLKRTKYIKSKFNEEEAVASVLAETENAGSPIRKSQLMDLLEFGRNIHAEMSAIADAARLGRNIDGATLYSTTFPCHICAKHIVAAGLKRVVYIEPYPKSYAEQLHADSISVGNRPTAEKRVSFNPFMGISPFRFRDLFERGRRKTSDGRFSEWVHGSPRSIVPFTIAIYLENEKAVTKDFDIRAKKLVEGKQIKMLDGSPS